MQRGLIFWVLMLIWVVFGLIIWIGGPALGGYAHASEGVNTLLLFILFALLGWQVYGAAIRG